MKKFCTQLILFAISFTAMAQSQYFYEWKDKVISIRNVSEIDSLTYPLSSDVAHFTTGSPSSLTGNAMTASYGLFISGVFPVNSLSEMGVCYSSTNSEPSVEDNKVKYGVFEEGTWEVSLTELSATTLYYYRPYLQVGDMVYYGPVKTFTTLKSSTETLWDLLESRKDLSKFCEIVGKTPYYLNNNQRASTLKDGDIIYFTFKDVLKANTHMTLWAPVNDAFTEEEWTKFSLLANTDGFLLQQLLIGNHMAMYSRVMSNTGSEDIRLINGKKATLDYDKAKFQNAKVVEKDIPAKNGVMHIIEKGNEYNYTLYEYIKYSGEVKTLRDYIVKRDTMLSIAENGECQLDEEGYPIYAPNAILSNMMFDHYMYPDAPNIDDEDAWMTDQFFFRAQLNNEDSAFVMIVPTDLAWANATEKLTPYYNYVSTYPRMDKTLASSTRTASIDIYGARHSYTTGKGYETIDSLRTANIEMDIVCPLVFNVNLQPKHNGEAWTLENFMNGGYKNCEYFLNTKGDTIRDIYEIVDGTKVLVWDKNSLFENSAIKKTMKTSNGYAIVTDNWNFPRDFWMRDIDIEANMAYVYDKTTSTTLTQYEMNNTTAAEWIDQYGRCSEQQYLQVAGTTNRTNPEVAFKLQGCKKYPTGAHVMSGKYDVQIVLVPRWYETSEEAPDTTATALKNRLVCSLYFWDENMIGKKDLKYDKQIELESEKIEYSGEKVDTITVFTDVEFPVSYQHLGISYPVLQIRSDRLSTSDTENNYSRAFNVDRIILKSKGSE